MRIRIWSDLHLETGTFVPPGADADLVVLAVELPDVTGIDVCKVIRAHKTLA